MCIYECINDTHMLVYECMYLLMCKSVYMLIIIHISVYMIMCLLQYICAYVCMNGSMFVCMCIYEWCICMNKSI